MRKEIGKIIMDNGEQQPGKGLAILLYNRNITDILDQVLALHEKATEGLKQKLKDIKLFADDLVIWQGDAEKEIAELQAKASLIDEAKLELPTRVKDIKHSCNGIGCAGCIEVGYNQMYDLVFAIVAKYRAWVRELEEIISKYKVRVRELEKDSKKYVHQVRTRNSELMETVINLESQNQKLKEANNIKDAALETALKVNEYSKKRIQRLEGMLDVKRIEKFFETYTSHCGYTLAACEECRKDLSKAIATEQKEHNEG